LSKRKGDFLESIFNIELSIMRPTVAPECLAIP